MRDRKGILELTKLRYHNLDRNCGQGLTPPTLSSEEKKLKVLLISDEIKKQPNYSQFGNPFSVSHKQVLLLLEFVCVCARVVSV